MASSCTKENDNTEVAKLDIMEIPVGFPSIVHPQGNEYSQERWDLGKKLFYDPILSRDGMVSCASCHDPALSFADNQVVSLGSDGLLGTRNAPSLANVAYHPYYTREGGIPTLEMQILVPIQEHNEFNNNALRHSIGYDSFTLSQSVCTSSSDKSAATSHKSSNSFLGIDGHQQ